MKNLNRELVILRTFTICTVVCVFAFLSFAFTSIENQKFGTIDVERINIVEADGTVKMIITNEEQFPTGETTINGRELTNNRKKRSGMLYFNEDGIECGGFIYDGEKDENGHSAGLSLTYDRYDGDQVMQLKTVDVQKGDKRKVSSSLVFNDRTGNLSQEETTKVMEEINSIEDKNLRRQKYKEYASQGLIGARPRIMIGKTGSENNGMFLFDDKGGLRANFRIGKDNQVKLEIYDEQGNVTSSWPE